MDINRIPWDLRRYQLFRYLPVEDILNLCSTGKFYRRICRDPLTWRFLLEQDFNLRIPDTLGPLTIRIYRDLFNIQKRLRYTNPFPWILQQVQKWLPTIIELNSDYPFEEILCSDYQDLIQISFEFRIPSIRLGIYPDNSVITYAIETIDSNDNDNDFVSVRLDRFPSPRSLPPSPPLSPKEDDIIRFSIEITSTEPIDIGELRKLLGSLDQGLTENNDRKIIDPFLKFTDSVFPDLQRTKETSDTIRFGDPDLTDNWIELYLF
jgi:hypothetical protein